jgi:hypothetical protein
MTAPAFELQALIVATLKANVGVMALINGVYDQPPPDPWGATKAYVSIGPTDVLIDDADCIAGEEHTVQLDVWSRAVGAVECKKICAAVKAALHQAEIVLTDNALVEIELQLYRVLRDPDGLTTHGVMQFRVALEEV